MFSRLASVVALALLATACSSSPNAGAPDAGAGDGSISMDGNAPADGGTMTDAGTAMESGPEGGLCNTETGLASPAQVCSPDNPCTDPTPIGADGGTPSQIVTPTYVPDCKTKPSYTWQPSYDDNPPKTLADGDGLTRYYCEYTPAAASSAAPLPLVLFFHGLGGGAQDLYNLTRLRQKADSYDLSGDSAHPGYHLISVQGRNLRDPAHLGDGPLEDFFYMDTSHEPSGNADIDFVDHLIDQEVATGTVDPHRIYLIGWSAGALFSALYGVLRHDTPTAGGNYVAAIVMNSGGDPYVGIKSDGSCAVPHPTTTLPILVVSHNCDIVTCSQDQFNNFMTQGHGAPFMNEGAWAATLPGTMADPNTQWLIIASGMVTSSCLALPACTYNLALRNHLTWPDGVNDKSGMDHEVDMLDFLKAHPH